MTQPEHDVLCAVWCNFECRNHPLFEKLTREGYIEVFEDYRLTAKGLAAVGKIEQSIADCEES